MINQLVRLGALIATGRFLKPRYKGLLLLALVWLILWFLHSEYVSYVELSNDRTYVLHASLLKLVLYALSVACYVLFVERPLWPKTTKAPAPAATSKPRPAAQSTASPSSQSRTLREGDDGFDFLRNKPKLKGSKEKPLEK